MVASGVQINNILEGYDDILTVKEVSKILKTNPATIRKMIHSKSIPAIKIGREYRILKNKLIETIL